MDPRAVELSDITKFYPTEESLKKTSIHRDDALFVSKEPFTIWQRKNNGTMEKFAPKNTLLVSETGGDYKTIKDALDSITDATQLNQYTIQVGPGNYLENNPIQCKEWVSVRSIGGSVVTAIVAKNANEDLFTMAAFVSIRGFNFFNVLGTGFAINMSIPGESVITDCIAAECSNGFLIDNINADLNITNCAIFNSGVTTIYGLHILAGSSTVTIFKATSGSTITTLIELDGLNSIAILNNVTSFGSGLDTAIMIKNGAEVLGATGNIQNCVDGLVLSGNNTKVRFDVLKLSNATQDGFRIENVGTGIELELFATTIVGCQRFNFNVLNPNVIVAGNGFTELDKSFVIPGAQFYAYLLDIKEGDEGLNILGELHVGTPARPAESAFGEGDSYTTGMLVYTETDGGVFVDESAAAASASGSTVTYPDVTVNSAIYIASSLSNMINVIAHYGIKTIIDTIAVFGSGNIILEYWNGSSWIEENAMEVDAGGSYWPHAKNYFQEGGPKHIRYNPKLAIDNWTKNDPIVPALGTDYFWIRFRIESEVTTVPIFEQIKLHANTFEPNADGWIEYRGKARPIGQLPFAIGEDKALEGNLGNQTLYINENIGAGLNQNSFNGINDKIGRFFFVPLELDTSAPIELKIAGRPSGTGTIQFTVRWDSKTQGEIAYTTEPSLAPGSRSVSVSKSVVSGEIAIYSFELDVSDVISRRENGEPDFIGMTIHSDILGGLSFAMIAIEANYTKWCQGGHI